MTTPNPENPPNPAQELRERRHRLAAEGGIEYFPSNLRYDLALQSLERILAENPAKGIIDLMDGLAKIYEYEFIVRKDVTYRHPELLAEIDQSLESARTALLASAEKLNPVERALTEITLSLTLAQEYLSRFHAEETNRDRNFGLSQHYVRMAIERILGAFGQHAP